MANNPFNIATPVFGLTQQQVDRVDAACDKIERLVQTPDANPQSRQWGTPLACVKGKLATELLVDSTLSLSAQSATLTYWCPSDPTNTSAYEAAVSDFQTLTVWPWGFPDQTIIPAGTAVTCLFMNGRWYVIPPNWQRIVQPTANIPAISGVTPGSGSGAIYTFNGTTLQVYGENITVYNLSNRPAMTGMFYEVVISSGYAFIVNTGGVTMFEATATVAFSSTSLNPLVTPTNAIWGTLPDPDTYPIVTSNDLSLSAEEGQTVVVVTADDGTQILLMVAPPKVILFEGTVTSTGGFATTDTTVEITPTKAIYGTLPATSPITANNDFQASGSYGQLELVAGDNAGNFYLIPTASTPLPILFWTTLAADLAPTDANASCNAGTIKIFGTMAAAAFNAANTLNLAGVEDDVVLVAGDNHMADGVPAPNYYLLAVPDSVMFLGTADAAFASSDTTTDITATTPIYGVMPDASESVNNPFKLSSRESDLTLSVESESTGEIYLAVVPDKVKAGIINFELTSDMSGGAATATVTDGYGSQGDTVTPEGSITVYDDDGLFPNALTGATGIAHYDWVNDEYHVIACHQMCFALWATVSGFTNTAATAPITSVTQGSPAPFDQVPSISDANNPLKLAANSGDTAYLEFDGTNWNVAEVLHYKQTVLTNEQLSGCALQTKTRDCVGIWNNSETSFATVSGWSATSTSFVSGVQIDTGGNLQTQTNSFCAINLGTAASYSTVTGGTSQTVTAVIADQYSKPYLQNKTQQFTSFLVQPASAWTTWFTAQQQDPITALQYYSSSHAFQYQTTNLYIFDQDSPSDWATWFTAATCTPVTALQGDGAGNLQLKTTTEYVIDNGTSSSWSTWFNGVSASPITSLQYSSHTLQLKTTPIYTLYTGSPSSWSTWFTPATCNPITNLQLSGNAWQYQTTQEYVFENGSAGSWSTWVTGNTCGGGG